MNVDIFVMDELSVVVYGIDRAVRSTALPPEHCAVDTVDEDMDSAHCCSSWQKNPLRNSP